MQAKAKLEADNLKRKKAQAAIKIWKAWKSYKQWHGLLKATVSSYKNKIAEKEQNRTAEIHILAGPTVCGRCKQQTAERFCQDCQQPDNQLFCIKCFQEFHVKGARKKHNRKQIVYKN